MYPTRTTRRSVQVVRSQLALRIGLAIYAILCLATILRCAVLILDYPNTVATVRTILVASAPIALPFSVLPGAERVILGSATLADITAALLIVAAPLLVVGSRSTR